MSDIRGRLYTVSQVGSCSVCNAPGVDAETGRLKDRTFPVMELNIGDQVVRLCAKCREKLKTVLGQTGVWSCVEPSAPEEPPADA